jgi:glycoprotein 3-alpha-L-fucosyltransferase
VGCVFTSSLTSERKPDAGFGYRGDAETASVLRSMESSHYYPENDIAVARGWVRSGTIPSLSV